MIRRMIGKREARRRFSDDVGFEKGVGRERGGEREEEREEERERKGVGMLKWNGMM